MAQSFFGSAEVRDTGRLRGDLAELALVWSDSDDRRDRLFVRLVSATLEDEQLRRFYLDAVDAPRSRAFAEIVNRAVDRGEIGPVADAHSLSRVFPAHDDPRRARLVGDVARPGDPGRGNARRRIC